MCSVHSPTHTSTDTCNSVVIKHLVKIIGNVVGIFWQQNRAIVSSLHAM